MLWCLYHCQFHSKQQHLLSIFLQIILCPLKHQAQLLKWKQSWQSHWVYHPCVEHLLLMPDLCNTWLQSWTTISYEPKRLHGSCLDRAFTILLLGLKLMIWGLDDPSMLLKVLNLTVEGYCPGTSPKKSTFSLKSEKKVTAAISWYTLIFAIPPTWSTSFLLGPAIPNVQITFLFYWFVMSWCLWSAVMTCIMQFNCHFQ